MEKMWMTYAKHPIAWQRKLSYFIGRKISNFGFKIMTIGDRLRDYAITGNFKDTPF